MSIGTRANQTDSDLSDTERSDHDDIPDFTDYSTQGSGECTSKHDGKEVLNLTLPISVDNLLTLLFTRTNFLVNFYVSRGSLDVVLSPWEVNSNSEMTRTLKMGLSINQPLVGKYHSQVTQTVVILKCSVPGLFYAVEAESHNRGVPFADSFYVSTHYCFRKRSDTTSSLVAYSKVLFSKTVWVRGLIERKTIIGIVDFHASLKNALQAECGEGEQKDPIRSAIYVPTTKRSFNASAPFGSNADQPNYLRASQAGRQNVHLSAYASRLPIDLVILWTLIAMLLLSVILFHKLNLVDDWFIVNGIPVGTDYGDLHLRQAYDSIEDEVEHLRRVKIFLQRVQILKWQEAFQATLVLLDKVETSLRTLQENIPDIFNKE